MNQGNVKCWGAPLGDCKGSITQEHIFTGALFKKRVTISGIYAMPDGYCPQWLTKHGLDMNIHKLTANILCDHHNKELGKTADRAAIDLQKALLATNDPTKLRGSRIVRPPVSRTISGVNFAKWLCKTHCNIMAANAIIPNKSYVQYAFGHTTEKRLYFYTPAKVGQKLPIGKGRISYSVYSDKDNPNTRIFEITLAGLRTLVASFPVNSIETAKLLHLKDSLIDRLKCLRQPTPLGWYKINLDWSNEPAYVKEANPEI